MTAEAKSKGITFVVDEMKEQCTESIRDRSSQNLQSDTESFGKDYAQVLGVFYCLLIAYLLLYLDAAVTFLVE